MKTLQLLARSLNRLALFAVVLTACSTARADVTRMSANPNPVRQGTVVTFSAYVNTGGRVDFFFLGRSIGVARFPTGPGWVSVNYVVPNVVPSGYQCIDKMWSAQQSCHRLSATLRVCR